MKRIIAGIFGILLILNVLPVCAQEAKVFVLENTPGQSVTLVTKNFPENSDFIVAMSNDETKTEFQDTARFNSAKGGYVVVIVQLPEAFADVPLIRLRVSGSEETTGNAVTVYEASFRNLPESEIPEAQPDLIPAAASDPNEVCDYSVVPEFDITEVIAGKSVSIEPRGFPADKDFRVLIGMYTDFNGTPTTYELTTCEGCFEPRTKTYHGIADISFDGIQVGTYRSSESHSLTYAIPEEYRESPAFILWLEEIGSCGRYAYSLVWNADATQKSEIAK